MIDFICSVGFVGLFCLLLSVLDLVFTFFLYVVYKIDGGKMGLIKYFRNML